VGDSEYRIRQKNGEIRWVRDIARATRTPDAQINSVQGVLYDVTERVYAEEAVRKSEAALIEAQAVAHVGSWTYDVAQDRLSWSDEMYRLYGLDPSIGEPNWPLKSQRIHPDDWEHLNRLFGETLAHGTPYHCEFRIIRPNGELAWVEMIGRPDLAADGSVARLSGTLQDITERKFAEQALRESEANLRQIIDTSPNGIFVKDREGRYVLVNKTVAALYGGQDAMLGKTDRELADVKVFAADDALAFVADDLEVMETLQPKGIPEMRFVGADGAERWFQTTKVPLLTDSGPVGVLGVSVDITERKLAEQERERLVTQLAQAQRMEAVGRLAGGVAHDFNNMLAVILGRSELALDLIHEADPIREELVEIERAAQRSANLTRQLLAFARRQTILPQVLDLNETMAGMLKMMQRLIGENIRLVWRPGADLWPVKIDPSQVDQISANLCVNARDAIDGVGQVTVETHNVAIDDAYCLEHAECVPGEYVQLAVSDDGCGMDQEVLGHLFEPFFTTKGVGEGTGLGLPTIYGIVKQNEGFVNVYSEPGVGSTFRIYLPRHIVEEEQQTAAQDTATSEIRGHETILLVEDEAAILRLSQTILEHLGYHVLTAATPGRALTIANAHPHAIHLLITDVIMPEMNGHDLAEQLTARYPEMRCLFTSGYTADVIASHGVLDAEVAFIAKPYTRRAFAARVRQVLDKR